METANIPVLVKKLQFISYGATGMVYQVDDHIAVKYVRDQKDIFRVEQKVFDVIHSRPTRCKFLVRSYYRSDMMTFLEYIPGLNLDHYLCEKQIRDEDERVIGVKDQEYLSLVPKWICQLAQAAAALEQLGGTHGDLHPRNILLCPNDDIRLIDFDRAETIGVPFEGDCAPYARMLNGDDLAHGKSGTFGLAGPQTEQFALGSIFYTMTRGFEPHQDQLGLMEGPKLADLFHKAQYPPLRDNDIDRIIGACWNYKFKSIQSLAEECSRTFGIDLERPVEINKKEDEMMKEKCRELAMYWDPVGGQEVADPDRDERFPTQPPL